MKKIKSKAENYELYFKGHYGNMLQTWTSLDSYFADAEYPGETLVALRAKNKPGIELPQYCSPTPKTKVQELATLWNTKYKIPLEDIVLNEIAPDDKLVFQGELMASEGKWHLRYSEVKTLMRQALKQEEKSISGWLAYWKIRRAMDLESWENLMRLIEEFPTSIIELSIYSCRLGDLACNSIIWEVRNY